MEVLCFIPATTTNTLVVVSPDGRQPPAMMSCNLCSPLQPSYSPKATVMIWEVFKPES